MAHEIISNEEIKDLAKRLTNADYDSVHEFLEEFGNNTLLDSENDKKEVGEN